MLTGATKDYYLKKISEIEQDLVDNEKGILILYTKKSDLINDWAEAKESIADIPTNDICRYIVNRLVDLDCTKGIAYVYKALPDKYKNQTRSDVGQLGGEARAENLLEFSSKMSTSPPHVVISLEFATKEELQENEVYYRRQYHEMRSRLNEYVKKMHDRGIPFLEQKESEVISTPRPYDPKEGHLWATAGQCHVILKKYADTYAQMQENIYYYPPQTEEEDLELAQGLQYWQMFFEALYEYHRPFADKKFSQSYVKWFRTEILNKDHGKHAAAVMSKVTSYLGEERALTREQVGDKLTDLYKKLVRFCGAMEMQRYIISDLPDEWHEKLMVPNIADRKISVGPILSDSAFGSSKEA